MATLLSRLRPCISVCLIASRVFSSPSFKPHNSLSSSSFSRPFLNPRFNLSLFFLLLFDIVSILFGYRRAFVGYPIKDADADAGGGGVSRAPIKDADADAAGGGVSRAPIKDADADAAGGGVSRAPSRDASAWTVFVWARKFYSPRKTGASPELSVSHDTVDDENIELYEVYMGERQPDE